MPKTIGWSDAAYVSLAGSAPRLPFQKNPLIGCDFESGQSPIMPPRECSSSPPVDPMRTTFSVREPHEPEEAIKKDRRLSRTLSE